MDDKKTKVLIAEDEIPMAKAMDIKLTKEGFETTLVHNGEDALAKIKEGGFDIILLDMIMPKMDGFTVLKNLQDEGVQTPPILVSSNLSQSEDVQKAKSLGATDFYVKSNTPLARIVEIIKNTLNRPE